MELWFCQERLPTGIWEMVASMVEFVPMPVHLTYGLMFLSEPANPVNSLVVDPGPVQDLAISLQALLYLLTAVDGLVELGNVGRQLISAVLLFYCGKHRQHKYGCSKCSSELAWFL